MESVPASVWVSLAESIGIPAAVIIMVIVFAALRKLDDKRLEREADRESKRAAEHMKKWDDVLNAHKAENDRQFKLSERQTEVLELHANLLQKIYDKVDNKTICPYPKGSPQ
jgi:flagellar biosynthesis/type III secretory pathway M-ring protein FliF/YscJ